MPIAALFDINLDGEDSGYEAANSESLSLKLRDPSAASTVLFQVYDPAGPNPELGIAANPPFASKGAPTLTLVGATSGQAVSPTTVAGAVTCAMPGTGSDSWIVRCVVNGGRRELPNGTTVVDPTLIYERGIFIPTAYGTRKVVLTERTQFEPHGWAGALADHMEAGTAGSPVDLVDLIDDEIIEWTESQTFSGSLVLGTVQNEAVPSSPHAVTLGASVTRLNLFGVDASVTINGATPGRMVLVHIAAGTKTFGGTFYRPGDVDWIAGLRASFWIVGSDDGAWRISETHPLYLPPAPAALLRTVRSRFSEDVCVTDFMTPAQIADANNGTRLFDHQPAIQAAIDWLLFGSLGSGGYVRGRLRLPAGILRIDRTVHINYGAAYRSMIFEGEGVLRGGEHGMLGTCIEATFGDAPAISVTAGLDVLIKSMSVVGLNTTHVLGIILGAGAMSHLDASAWVDPALPAVASSRYAPYAGIAIDPYCGPQPTPHYPDVPFPDGFNGGGFPQYNKPPSRNISIEDVNIQGFVVAIALQACDFDGSGDFVHINRVSAYYNTFIWSWGNSQARANTVTDCTFQAFHTAFATTIHGHRTGNPQISVQGCSFEIGMQLFEINNLGYGIGPNFLGCFAEAMYRIGVCNGVSQNAGGLAFRNCEFGFSWWDRYGVPTWVLEMEGSMQITFEHVFFYMTAFCRGFASFRCSGSALVQEPGRQLQFNGLQTQAPEIVGIHEKCAFNGTLGLVLSLGSTSLDRFSVNTGYMHNLDSGALLGIGALFTEQATAPRNVCAPVYAKKLKSLVTGNDPGVDVAWPIVAYNVATVVSTVGRIVTITIAGLTTAGLMHTGGDVGDVFVAHVSQGVAWVVKSRTGTQLTLEAMSGFDKDGALLTPVVPGLLLYAINCRRYALTAVLYGDITTGSPVVTNVILGNGGPPVLADIVTVDDYLYVDSDVDQIINPIDGSARLASFDDGANTLTFAGNFFITQTRRRFLIFVRPAMPNT